MSLAAQERWRLHGRVRAFIEESARGADTSDDFETLACAIACYQADHVPAYARLLAAERVHPRSVTSVRALPAVPTEAFRLTRIAAHAPSDDAAIFRTSGTTGAARGEHPFSTTETYECAALTWGRWALFFDSPPALTAIIFGAGPVGEGDSSLGFMLGLFADRFAVRTHRTTTARGAPIDSADLTAVCDAVCRAEAPVIVMGTSFAFVHALDALGGARFALPPGSRAMHTGGYKGRSREVAPDSLRTDIAATFGLDTDAVVGEYGMTELSSQLYEGTLRVRRGLWAPISRHGFFVPPPWLRVVATDPDTLEPLGAGVPGILRFEDLANVDSAIAVQTADVGRCSGGAVELLGRAPGAPPRGCSLAIEELLGP